MANHNNQTLEDRRLLNEKSWQRGYHLFPSILNTFDCKIGAEIGVAFGGHSESILSKTNIEKLYCVDSYQHRSGYDDGMNLPQSEFDQLYERTSLRLKPFGDRFQMVRMDSLVAAQTVPDNLDFVYIDADHTYEGCMLDILTWFDKVRADKIIGGHDYESTMHPGVTRAVHDVFDFLGWQVHSEGYGCWWVQKLSLSGQMQKRLHGKFQRLKAKAQAIQFYKHHRRKLGRVKRWLLSKNNSRLDVS